jgi:hypothetical protein
MPVMPSAIDTTRPHPARMYDYFLGGPNNFAADRVAADKVLAGLPASRTFARENRAFLGRAVRYLAAEAGIRQFLDIGPGLPAVNSVHEVAQALEPSTRVLYADNDPLVLAHARALLPGPADGRTACIQADLRDPAAILADPVTADVLDFSRPVGLILGAVLHFLQDDDSPQEIIRALAGALPSGSYLVATHLSGEHDRAGVNAAGKAYRRAGVRGQARDSREFARLVFGGLELVPPGVALVSEWRRAATEPPPPAPADVNCYGGVARKR